MTISNATIKKMADAIGKTLFTEYGYTTSQSYDALVKAAITALFESGEVALTNNPASPCGKPDDLSMTNPTEAMREAFEAHFAGKYNFERCNADVSPRCNCDKYMHDPVTALWTAWQAATLANDEKYRALVEAANMLSYEMHKHLDDFAPAKYRTPFECLARLDNALAQLQGGERE